MCEACFERSDAGAAPGKERSAVPTRRGFLMLGLGVLAGCAAQPRAGSVSSEHWPEPAAPYRGTPPRTAPPVAQPPAASASGAGTTGPWRHAVLPRSAWAKGDPVPTRMDRMTPVRFVTVHHDGMDPFYATDRDSIAHHIESIRRLHRRKGWGDIGYHFAVDRAGRVWEARSIWYQGAHVKDHNPGNVGIVVLGNFEEQAPTEPQLAAVRGHLSVLMRAFRIPVSRINTHQEWQGAATACPGNSLQSYLVRLRGSGELS